jgi:hypothetical protein
MKGFVFALFVFAAVCYAQTPQRPMPSEVFEAATMVEIHDHDNNFSGKGRLARNQPAGKGLTVRLSVNNTEMLETLERYDTHQIYDIRGSTHECAAHAVEGNMPLHWDWLKNATFVGKRKRNHSDDILDIWEARMGYSRLEIAVGENATNVPVWETREAANGYVEYTEFVQFSTQTPDDSAFDVPSDCKTFAAPQCVERATMIARAQAWVDAKVPYNQGADYQGYREDCSGYVSMAWQLAGPGLTTETLDTVSHAITKAELAPGDVLLCKSEHVVLFGGWVSSAQTQFVAFEETRPGEGTVKRATPYPYWYNTACFQPYRLNTAC